MSMANFRSQNKLSFFIFSLFFHFSHLLIPAVASYVFPDFNFINCGSAATLTIYGRKNFTGDETPQNYVLHSGDGEQVEDNLTPSPNELYRSARVIRKSSWYEFNLNANESGIYVVRLHFFPFSSMGNLSEARFTVSTSNFILLSDLDFGSNSYSNLPLIEEFLINVTSRKLRIGFVPDEKQQSFAFINAIEVFLAPPELVQSTAPPRVTRQGMSDERFDGFLGFPLRVAHRINVGGENITRETDTLMRYWIPDDAYLLLNNTAINKGYNDAIKYQSELAKFVAPYSVYNTAKVMNVKDGDSSPKFNISWRFEVGKGAQYLVRFHFCDIVTRTTNENTRFNLYIYSGFREPVIPWDFFSQPAAPFFIDFVVDSDDSGFMNISIGPHPESELKTAFLNGVEIMEVIRVGSAGHSAGKGSIHIIIGCSIGAVALVILISTLLIFFLRRNKCKKHNEPFEWALASSRSSKTKTVRTGDGSIHAHLNLGLKVPLSSILFATKKFSAKLMIGEGGFGKVYKGKLRDGRKVAIKRSEAGHGQGLEEFHTEITVLSKIRHHHLVSLIGYCHEKDEMILLYEFMEKGALRDHLYSMDEETKKHAASTSPFSWEQRLEICIGAAKGLHYLHTGCSETIVHRDIKSTNILLDESYVAKVADFGLSRTGSLEQTHFSTQVKGSFGYLDPEYYSCFRLTQKSDVYSFGVVLLEVLCARPAVDPSLSQEEVNLADWGMSRKKKGELESVVDPFLVGKINPSSLRVFGETVEKCLQECGDDRPIMSDVLWCLEHCLKFQQSGICIPREMYEDSRTTTTTEMWLGLPSPVVRRLPSNSMSVCEDEVPFRYYSFSDESGEVRC